MNSISFLPMLGSTSSYGSQADNGNNILSLLGSLFGSISGQQQDPYAAYYQYPGDQFMYDSFEQDPYSNLYSSGVQQGGCINQDNDGNVVYGDPQPDFLTEQTYVPAPRQPNLLETILPLLTSVLEIVMSLMFAQQEDSSQQVDNQERNDRGHCQHNHRHHNHKRMDRQHRARFSQEDQGYRYYTANEANYNGAASNGINFSISF